MLALRDRHGLNRFAQNASGRLVFENAAGRIPWALEFATMGGALRVEGRLARFTDTLASKLGDRLRLDSLVHRVLEEPGGVSILTSEGHVHAGQVILAMPPRLAAGLGVSVPDAPT